MSHLRLVGLLGRHRWVLLPLVGLGLLVAATWAAQALVTARVFAVVLEPEGGPTVAALAPLLVALVAVLVVRPLLVLARAVVATALMGRVKTDLRDRLAELLTRRTARAAGRGRTGHDHAVLVDGVENLDPYLGRYVPQLAVTVLTMLAVATVMAVIDPVVAGVVVLGGAVVLALPHAWEAALARRGADHWEAYSTLHADFVDSMQGMTTLVTFGAAERRQRALAAASQRLLASTLRQLRLSLLEFGLNGFALAAVPVVAVAVVLARRDTLDVFSGFALVLLAVELVRPLKDLASLWHAGYLGTFSGREVATALAATDLDRPADWRPAPQLALRDVTLTHVDGRSAALVDVDLAVGPGLTAVVGPSGGGKSTLVGVLAGLHRPDAGVLEAPDDPLRHVALVPQDPVLLAGTVAENIAAGLPEPVADPHLDAQVVRAATTAGIGTDDPSLTLDSPVGERGQLLSGGQRQRVAIARGLAQERPVLVLDEATSALDARSEERLLRRLRDLTPGRSVVLVAHRPAVVAVADRVVEVDAGRVSQVDHRREAADVGAAR